MPKMDGTGPDGKGAKSGRRLGECADLDDAEKLAKLGKGMGKKRKAGCGEGQGKRLRTDEK